MYDSSHFGARYVWGGASLAMPEVSPCEARSVASRSTADRGTDWSFPSSRWRITTPSRTSYFSTARRAPSVNTTVLDDVLSASVFVGELEFELGSEFLVVVDPLKNVRMGPNARFPAASPYACSLYQKAKLVLQDLRSVTPPAGSDVGRGGMSAEQVLRALLVKQLNQFTYRELAFHLADSRSYRTFCQLGIIEPTPSKSTLAANIKAVKFETLEQINRELVSVAEDAGIEKGRKVRVDCTVVESNIHPPTDSELLYDCVRVLTRVMCRARELLGTVVVFGNRTRRAKRRRLGVLNAKDKQQRRGVYRDLLKVTEETYRSAQRVAAQLEESGLDRAGEASERGEDRRGF